jgi:hypothetical protein
MINVLVLNAVLKRRASEILGNRLEFSKGSRAPSTRRPERSVETMANVVMNQRFLGIIDRIFHGLQLLS